ncbi:hypothetical protein KAS79_00300 [Candidatus Parcubacteria bacterium]|nr:hypothetical protein [Candidatus Parcubacteria bacterium]
MDLALIHKIIVMLIDAIGLWLAFWVLSANRKSKVNQMFFLMTIFILLWITLCYFSGTLIHNLELSLFLGRLAYGTTILFFIPFYFFSLSFVEKKERFLLLKILIPISSLILFLFSVFTDFMAVYMTPTKFGVVPILGQGKFIYFGFVLFVTLLVIIRLFKKYFKSLRKEKLKVQYFLVGLFIFIVANLIFNVILPFGQKIPQYYYIGNYSVVFLLGFTAYAIVKQELFEIKVVLTSLLVGLIAILLLINTLVSQTTFEYAWKGAIFVLFLVFGQMLIKNITGEVKRREEVEKISNAKSEFISIASHQLRAPLTAVKGYISMLVEGTYGNLPRKALMPMKNVYTSNERLLNLVENLLNVSRIESGRIEMNYKETSLEDLISSVIKEMKINAREKKIYLKFEKSKKPLPKINIDPQKIRQVVLNLIDNAIHYTKKGGIIIKIKIQDSKYQIQIIDTGEGMTKEELGKVFQSFSRGTAGNRFWTEGAGLGLYIARKFVEMHKGKIWAESKGRSKGSQFYVELPAK